MIDSRVTVSEDNKHDEIMATWHLQIQARRANASPYSASSINESMQDGSVSQDFRTDSSPSSPARSLATLPSTTYSEPLCRKIPRSFAFLQKDASREEEDPNGKPQLDRGSSSTTTSFASKLVPSAEQGWHDDLVDARATLPIHPTQRSPHVRRRLVSLESDSVSNRASDDCSPRLYRPQARRWTRGSSDGSNSQEIVREVSSAMRSSLKRRDELMGQRMEKLAAQLEAMAAIISQQHTPLGERGVNESCISGSGRLANATQGHVMSTDPNPFIAGMIHGYQAAQRSLPLGTSQCVEPGLGHDNGDHFGWLKGHKSRSLAAGVQTKRFRMLPRIMGALTGQRQKAHGRQTVDESRISDTSSCISGFACNSRGSEEGVLNLEREHRRRRRHGMVFSVGSR
jgi:hypothetical protein